MLPGESSTPVCQGNPSGAGHRSGGDLLRSHYVSIDALPRYFYFLTFNLLQWVRYFYTLKFVFIYIAYIVKSFFRSVALQLL